MFLRLLVITVGNLLTVRLVLGALGVENYGLVAAVGAVSALLVFLNGVLTSTAQRFLSFEIGRGGTDALSAAFSSVCWISVVLCALIFLAGETAGLWFVCEKLSVPEGMRAVAVVVYEANVLQMVLRTACIPFSSLISATERMGFFVWASFVDIALTVVIAVALLLVPAHRPEVYACLEVLSSALMLALFAVHGRRLCPELGHLIRPSVAVLRGQCAYFLWSSLHAVVNALKYNGVGLLVNLFAGVASNAAWRLGYVYGSHVGSVCHCFQQAYFPQMVKLWAQEDRRPFRVLALGASRWSFAVTAVFAVPLLVCTEPVLGVLVGGTLPPGTVAFVRCFVLHYLIDSMIEPLHSAALVPGRIAGYEIGQVLTIGSGFVLAVLAFTCGFPPWTSVGAVALATGLNLVYHLFYLRRMGFGWGELLLLRAHRLPQGNGIVV